MVVLNLDNTDTREIVETCFRTHKTLINPLIDWDDDFVWWYIEHEKITINPLYYCGFSRIGCIGCPMAGEHRWEEFARYPQYKRAYIKAFDKMLIARKENGNKQFTEWETGLKVFKWWMQDKNIDGQLAFDEMGDIYEEYTDIYRI